MVKYSRTLLWSVAIACFVFAGPASARTSDEIKALKEEVAAMREGQEKMQKDLDEIKKLIQQGARPAPARAGSTFTPKTIELGSVSSRGDADAPVTLIEYSDYDCPFCKRHAETVMPALIEDYVNTGKLRFIMREYPIDRLHPRATAASEAVLCAGDQGDYWGMHDAMFANQKANTDDDFRNMVADLGLDVDAFNACMESDKFTQQIRSDIAEGQGLGVSGTPSFVVGLTDPEDSNTVNLTKFIRGAQPLPSFKAAIDELLKTAEMEKK
jgi:protein-disulfide isomerase